MVPIPAEFEANHERMSWRALLTFDDIPKDRYFATSSNVKTGQASQVLRHCEMRWREGLDKQSLEGNHKQITRLRNGLVAVKQETKHCRYA